MTLYVPLRDLTMAKELFLENISPFSCLFQKYSISLPCLHTEASLVGGSDEDGDLYIKKSVILRFVLGVLESGSFKLIVKNKATMTLMGM